MLSHWGELVCACIPAGTQLPGGLREDDEEPMPGGTRALVASDPGPGTKAQPLQRGRRSTRRRTCRCGSRPRTKSKTKTAIRPRAPISPTANTRPRVIATNRSHSPIIRIQGSPEECCGSPVLFSCSALSPMCPGRTVKHWSRGRDLNPRPADYEMRSFCLSPLLSVSPILP